MLDWTKIDRDNPNKLYIDVWTATNSRGDIKPLAIRVGEKLYKIDRVLDVRPQASRKIGGSGIRYLCRIRNQEVEIYREGNRWFMENPENKRT